MSYIKQEVISSGRIYIVASRTRLCKSAKMIAERNVSSKCDAL